jgi:6-phospho-beta-glucosidase
LVGGISRRIFAKYGHPGTITFTTDLDQAVVDAEVVLIQLRVGGQAARLRDETSSLWSVVVSARRRPVPVD